MCPCVMGHCLALENMRPTLWKVRPNSVADFTLKDVFYDYWKNANESNTTIKKQSFFIGIQPRQEKIKRYKRSAAWRAYLDC